MKSLFLLPFLVLTLTLQGQRPVKPVFCGNEIFSDIVRNHYPALAEDFNTTFEQAKEAISQRSDEPLTVRVVIHVVWNAPEENLHDSIILNQLDILNKDYNRLNADTNNLRSIFQDEAGTANIHFQLEHIERVETENLFVVDLLGGTNLLSEVKSTDLGGSDAWDTESYLNIWIVNIQPIELFGIPVGQILGFAFPPSGLPHWPDGVSAPNPDEDGVVLDYRVVGKNNPNQIEMPDGSGGFLTVHGRSATHEVGHYLGLRHIWGDGGVLGPNDCQQSDGIDDTPYADSQSAFDCDKTKNSCAQIETHYSANMPDLIENYMDYSAEDCMNMFTKGQATLMRNVLTGPRSGLIAPASAVNDIHKNPSFEMYPNPVSDVVALNFEVGKVTDLTIRFSDINGHLTLAKINQLYEAGPHRLSINVDGFAPGIYFVELRTKDGVSVKKLVIE